MASARLQGIFRGRGARCTIEVTSNLLFSNATATWKKKMIQSLLVICAKNNWCQLLTSPLAKKLTLFLQLLRSAGNSSGQTRNHVLRLAYTSFRSKEDRTKNSSTNHKQRNTVAKVFWYFWDRQVDKKCIVSWRASLDFYCVSSQG